MDTKRKKEIYKRVDEAFRSVGIETQEDQGAVCKVDQTTVSKWKRGINAPTPMNMVRISERTGYEINWMYLGTGRKFIQPEDEISDKLNRLLKSVDEEKRAEVYRVARALLTDPEEDEEED